MIRGERAVAWTARVVRLAGLIAAIVLIGFHAVLFWRRILDASITEPAVMLRWIASVLLVFGVVTVRRSFMRQLGSGRSTLVLVLLVLLVHAGVPSSGRVFELGENLAENLAVLGPVGLSLAPLALLGLALTHARLATSCSYALVPRGAVNPYPSRRAFSPDAPRPPPAV